MASCIPGRQAGLRITKIENTENNDDSPKHLRPDRGAISDTRES